MKTTRAILFALGAILLATPVYAQFQVGGSSGGGAGVSTFNGRSGAVTPQSGDYTAAQVGAAPQTSGTAILKGNGTGGTASAVSGTDYAPATSGTAILKGNGSGGTASAVSGTDYAPATSGTSVLKGNGAGGTTAAVSGTDYGNVNGPASSTSGNFPSFNGTGGKTLQDSTYSPASFAPAGVVSVVTGSNPTTNAAAWSAFTQYTIGGSGRTITLPASSGLSANGGLFIDANTNSATLTATSPDTITYSGATTGAGGSVTLPAGQLYAVTTDAAGKIYVSGRAVQGNGLKTQLSTGSTTTNNCVKFDANGNTVDAGAACGGGSSADGSFNQQVIATYWYWSIPGISTNNGSSLSSTTIYYRPFYVGTSHTIGALGAYLVTASAGGNCAFAVYSSSGTTGRPTGAALGSVSGVSTTTAGPIHGNVSIAVTKGNWYWDAIICDNATVTFTTNSGTSGGGDTWLAGATSEAVLNGNSTNHFTQYASTGATYPTFPSSPTVSDSGQTSQRTPLFYHQIASVP